MSSLYCFRSSTCININTVDGLVVSDVRNISSVGGMIDNGIMRDLDDRGYTLFYTISEEIFDQNGNMFYVINTNSFSNDEAYVRLRHKVLSTLRSEKIEKII